MNSGKYLRPNRYVYITGFGMAYIYILCIYIIDYVTSKPFRKISDLTQIVMERSYLTPVIFCWDNLMRVV